MAWARFSPYLHSCSCSCTAAAAIWLIASPRTVSLASFQAARNGHSTTATATLFYVEMGGFSLHDSFSEGFSLCPCPCVCVIFCFVCGFPLFSFYLQNHSISAGKSAERSKSEGWCGVEEEGFRVECHNICTTVAAVMCSGPRTAFNRDASHCRHHVRHHQHHHPHHRTQIGVLAVVCV